jgi:hypothetical protein
MKHTEILDEYLDIVTIRHCADVEITGEYLLENLHVIQEQYPEKKLLLIDHAHSYSLSFGAMQLLQDIECFDRMASLVLSTAMAKHIERSLLWVQFSIPFRVCSDIESALRFLRGEE